ncbi:DUF4012 domain-containing protein [Nocardioides cynanchi]|uniref:DUF4012 domain-containing protein n=1 Tax=Nocardioides cynanchi TaxID=2558918 RepID=UPI001248E054|nr:DUF4012 domain-containing protein [Nocardioides cynanchi]
MKHRDPSRRVRVPGLGAVSRRLLIRVGCGVGLLVAAFLLTLLPLLLAHHDAAAAANELQQANDAVSSEQIPQAQQALAQARGNVQGAQGHLDGFVANAWSHLPVLGPAVADGRHLVAALDQATTAATIGVNLIAHATSPESQLIEGTRVNIHDVRQIAAQARRIGPHLRAAQAEIAAVRGNDPLVGGKIDSLKKRATEQLSTTQGTYRSFKPLLDQLPAVLGARGRRTYLLTIMNPAEQRFSGGATLQMASITFDHGLITFGRSQSVADVDQAKPFLNWPPVKGNLFHPPGPRRLAAAAYSPWWRVSGEELLRAWQAQTGQRCQGLIAVDLQALAELFRITGPMQVPGYGELNADNLVQSLAGSYDSFQNAYQRRRLNNALVPAFQQKFLSGGNFVAKARSLLDDAKGRHVALYFRQPLVQHAFASAGFSGNLSTTRHDYLGVFTQNLNGSKSDFWQSRQVDMQVGLRPDGSAAETLNVLVQNPAPPYTLPTPDPQTGYDTRWLGTLIGVFLPYGAQLEDALGNSSPMVHESLEQSTTRLPGVRNRPVLRHGWLLAPQQGVQLTVRYTVPHAATVDRASGDLMYRVALDPQDLVQPQTNAISLTIPSGYTFGTLPSGWTLRSPQLAVLVVPQLTESSSWKVPVVKQ